MLAIARAGIDVEMGLRTNGESTVAIALSGNGSDEGSGDGEETHFD